MISWMMRCYDLQHQTDCVMVIGLRLLLLLLLDVMVHTTGPSALVATVTLLAIRPFLPPKVKKSTIFCQCVGTQRFLVSGTA